MKRTLALGLLLAAPLALAQTDTQDQTLTANINAAVQITLGADPALQAFNAAVVNTINMTMTVDSTSAYTVHATAPNALNGENQGTFNEYDTGTTSFIVGGNNIAAAHTVAIPTDGNGTGSTSVLPDAVGATGLVYTGNAAIAAKALTATLSVTPPFGTPRLTGTRQYRLVITYTLTATP